MLQYDNDGRGLVTSLAEGKDRSFNEMTANWVMTQTHQCAVILSFNKMKADWVQLAVILLNDLSFPSPALATPRITALWDISALATQC